MQIGDVIEDFELPDENGDYRRLSDFLAEGPVVLFFYPQAMTYGCTRESCHFRDLATEFKEVGASRVGISADKVDKQKEFSEKHAFDFPLLSDSKGVVAEAFGVRRARLLGNKRAAFVIGTDATLLGELHSEVNFSSHADKALALLRQRASAA